MWGGKGKCATCVAFCGAAPDGHWEVGNGRMDRMVRGRAQSLKARRVHEKCWQFVVDDISCPARSIDAI